MTWRTSFVAGTLAAALAATVAAQQAPSRDRTPQLPTTGTANISGTVLNDASGRPLRRAMVSILSTDSGLRLLAVTGDDGRFGFTELPAGRYSLGASRTGYVTTTFGAKKLGRPGVPVSLADGEQKTDVTMRLLPGAVITGAVRTASGDPLPGARVILLKRSVSFDTGESALVRADYTAGLGEVTDDRGVYRSFGLPPDDYYVVVTVGNGIIRNMGELRQITPAELDWAARMLRDPGSAPPTPPPAPGPAVDYAPVFYPGVPTAGRASTVTVKAGEERDGIDIVVDFVPTAKITGRVSLPGGGPPPNLQVSLIAHDTIPGIPFSGFGNARTDPSGRFVSGGMVPGDYTIMVRTAPAPGGAGSPLFGVTTVSVNGSDVTAPITLESGVTVSGHVAFDGNAPPPRSAGIRVNLTVKRTSGPTLGVPAAVTDASGAFTFAGVAPGSYHLASAGAGGWQVKSASAGGQEALDGYIDVSRTDVTDAVVTFTNQVSEISGSLVDAVGNAAPEYTIVIFPADKAFWIPGSRRIQSSRPATDGRFRVTNLPPGDYRIAAVTDVEPGEWYSPAFLADLLGASRGFTLAEGQKITQDLKVAGGS